MGVGEVGRIGGWSAQGWNLVVVLLGKFVVHPCMLVLRMCSIVAKVLW
jgi:hypothetical protein